MSKIIKLRKGLDVNLQGKAEKMLVQAPIASEYAVSPLDFEGVTPKMLVRISTLIGAIIGSIMSIIVRKPAFLLPVPTQSLSWTCRMCLQESAFR